METRTDRPKTAVVAGHICLDVLPDLSRLKPGEFAQLFQPGHVVLAGPASIATGGAVSNTGLALHILGIPVCLIAKVGGDAFGKLVVDLVDSRGPGLSKGIVVDPNSSTSYSVIINPPAVDRTFIHSAGANDSFSAADIDYEKVARADLFHFGYPPVMRSMYVNDGYELVEVMRRAKSTGATTSLDMAFPDPSSESGKADWHRILQNALPFVDVFLPSIEELLYMIRRELYDQLWESGKILPAITRDRLDEIGSELLSMGAKIVGIKLGERGFALYTANETLLSQMGRAIPYDPRDWANCALWAPCFQVPVVGTTGAGDATIAGFLAALLRGLPPQEAATMAVAVGACNVEAVDALSGLRSWESTLQRVREGWARYPEE